MELLVLFILWCLFCHFFVKPYEARKKKEVKKKKRKKRGSFLNMFFFREKSFYERQCDDGSKFYE